MAGTHWRAADDPKTGRTYYYHEITRETQWGKPSELASDEERRAIEEKDRKQRDFFAAMEANILNSLSQGRIPGTNEPKEPERRKSSRRMGAHPELVRTISTMDSLVLKDLIQRQPSFRSLSKNPSLNPAEFTKQLRPSHIDSSQFESFVAIMSDNEQLQALHESDDSMPGLFSYIPDDNELDDESAGSNDNPTTSAPKPETTKDGSTKGYGLSSAESEAMKRLASITKEMIDVDLEDDEAPARATNGIAKDNKSIRELPREMELDDSSEDEENSEDGVQKPSTAFQKAKDIGGRELNFDESDEEDSISDGGVAPTPIKPRKSDAAKTKKPDPVEDEQRPDFKRRNTCGTLYVGSTMSVPDKDANIKVSAIPEWAHGT